MLATESLCPRCGWMLPHDTCPAKRGSLPTERPMRQRAKRVVEPEPIEPEPQPAPEPGPEPTGGLLQDPAFDDERRAIRCGTDLRSLGWVQWNVLAIFRRYPDKCLNRDRLEVLWEHKPEPPCETLITVHVHQLRQKLKGTGWRIRTVWGHGYMLEREG